MAFFSKIEPPAAKITLKFKWLATQVPGTFFALNVYVMLRKIPISLLIVLVFILANYLHAAEKGFDAAKIKSKFSPVSKLAQFPCELFKNTGQKCIDMDKEGVAGEEKAVWPPNTYKGLPGKHKVKGTICVSTYNPNLPSPRYTWKKLTDACLSETTLKEFHCENYKINDLGSIYSLVECPADHVCKDGACVPSSPCIDSMDEGYNISKKGVTKLYGLDGAIKDSFEDHCDISGRFVYEGYCSNDQIASAEVDCCSVNNNSNWICKGGECTAPQKGEKDTDGDGVVDICEGSDLCDWMPGVQFAYPFDTDGDKKNDSCYPVKEDFCTDPNPQETYPNGTLYSYEEKLHIGFCYPWANNKIMHIICGEDKKWSATITPCDKDLYCQSGACYPCVDSDVDDIHPDGINYDTYGVLTFYKPGWKEDKSHDHCYGYKHQVEMYCDKGNVKKDTPSKECPAGKYCKEVIKDGEVVDVGCFEGKEPTCTDTDGANFDTYGWLGGEDPFGMPLIKKGYHDFCNKEKKIDWYCENGEPKSDFVSCEKGYVCKGIKEEGKTVGFTCVPEPKPTCNDLDGGINYEKYSEVKYGGYIYHDYCNGDSIVDYYCDKGEPKTSSKPCEEGKTCKLDSTAKTFDCVWKCVDTDPNNDEHVAGVVYDWKKEPIYDFCEKDQVKQYKCNNETSEAVEAGVVVCPNGCDGGACK